MKDNPESKPSPQFKEFEPDPGASRLKFKALVGFMVLLAGVFIVVMILPSLLAKKNDQAAEIPGPETAESNVLVDQENQIKAKEVRALLNEVLALQARLENEGVEIWGAEKLVTSYGEVLALIAKADADADQQHYDQALAGYREAQEKLEQLQDSRPQRAEVARQNGDEAFKQLDGESAKYHYGIAAAAEPHNMDARALLQRAENLEQVLQLIEEGQELERSGQRQLARKKYSEAASLDPEFQPAQDHFQRIDAAISDSDFSKFMSEAEAALKQEDIEKAKEALTGAQSLKPDASSVHDLEKQLNKMALYSDVQLLGRKALEHEMAEEWRKASGIYTSILKMDPNAGFAQEGKKRMEDLLELIKEMQSYLTDPVRLQEPEHIDHARALHGLALTHRDAGPKFRQLTDQLKSFLTQYNKLVSVVILSDNLTKVQVYRVGQFGQFLEHKLELLPGNYKAVGNRSGYRDVHVPFTVPVSGEAVNLEVICKEAI